ncbi:Uncharacterized conserved protein (DUF2348) [Nesidiocoris tenuis]|uniref:Elongator complex protein 6 n=1 Tax=Nesidiocoris tenuis TaxID=355587 RepID=A0ABN7BGS1_9HEMI|nr:Uncharacterized conserved protein (DUF2348) [Nesidiocoris tenuis]
MASFVKGLELDKEDFSGKLIAIEEADNVDGCFCSSCLIWQCLSRPDSCLMLVALHRPFSHYYHVGMKLGYNLASQSERAAILEMGKSQAELSAGEDESLKKLVVDLRERIKSFAEYKRIYIFVDNLSSLLFLGYSVRQVKIFVHYLRTLLSDKVTVVLSAQTDAEDEDELELASLLRHIADLQLRVAPLSTGSSQAVSGSIELRKKDHAKVESWTKSELYHYKLSERNVRVFRPGNV